MSEDLLTQLADYGSYHRAGQQLTDPATQPGITVVELQTVHNRSENPVSKKLLLRGALAAAATIAVIVGVIVATNDDDDSPTAGDVAETFDEESALRTAAAFFDNYNAGEDQGVLGLFIPDIAITDSIVGRHTLDGWEQLFVWNAAQGSAFGPRECTSAADSGGLSVAVECQTENQDVLVQAVSAPGIPTAVKMTVTPEGIADLRFVYGSPNFNGVGIPFRQWMARENPDDLASVGFGSWTTVGEAQENGRLTAQFALEWAAFLEANNCGYRDGC